MGFEDQYPFFGIFHRLESIFLNIRGLSSH